MKKIVSIFLLLIILTASLASCTDDDGAPRGMKLASDRTAVDYSFYIPEEWIIDEMSTFSRAHAKGELSSVSVFTLDCDSEVTISDWWSTTYRPQIEGTMKDFAFVEQIDSLVVDKKSASAFVFTSSRAEGIVNKHRLTITKNGSKMYVIWFTSLVSEEHDYYSEELVYLNDIVNVFEFSEKQVATPLAPFEDESAPEGMMLISNKNIVLYSLYVPSTWIIDEQSAMTMAHASNENKSSVSVMQWNMAQGLTTIDEWWNDYHKAEMQSTWQQRFVIKSEGTEVTLGANEAKAYEYEISLSGLTYRFYVVASIDQGSIHVLTYTSTADLFESELNTVKEQIIPNFKFN